MKVERHTVTACCHKTGVTLKLSSQVSNSFIPLFVNNGFKEVKRFTASGMLYIESINLIATGVFGADNLQIKCKAKDCEPFINSFMKLLETLE